MSIRSEQLLPASFRGVPFEVTSGSLKAGRRTVVHEYPQRDKPYVEDLGKATRQITIEAFVVGDDYIARGTALLAEIEKPGSGALIHPWLGEMTVTVTSVSELKFDTGLGTAYLTFVATEAGDLEFPATGADTQSAALEAADGLELSAVSKFVGSIDLSIVSEYIDAALSGALLDVLGVVGSAEIAKAFGFATGVADLASKGLALISKDPKVFAQKLAGALGLSKWATTATAWSRVAKQLRNLASDEKLSSGTRAKIEVDRDRLPLSDTQKAAMTNRAAVESLARQLLLAQVVGVSALIGTSKDTSAPGAMATAAASPFAEQEPIQSYDDLIEVRNELLDVLDQELLMEVDDEMYQAIEQARTAVFEAVTERANAQSRLITVTPPDIMPAVVLAYDYHDDANRDREIALRNGIDHEGFCPAEEMKVSSE
jgi:DNA circulation-like